VDNSLDARILLEYTFESWKVAAVHLFKSRTHAAYFFDAFYNFSLRIAQVVNDYHIIACGLKFNGGVRTNKARTTSDKDGLFHIDMCR